MTTISTCKARSRLPVSLAVAILMAQFSPAVAGSQDIGIDLPTSMAGYRTVPKVAGSPVVEKIVESRPAALPAVTVIPVAATPSRSIEVPLVTAPRAMTAPPVAPVIVVQPLGSPVLVVPPPISKKVLRKEIPMKWMPPPGQRLADSLSTPVSFRVTTIAGGAGKYTAVVEYKKQNYVVSPGDMVPDQDDPAFQVRSITEARVEVYDPATKRVVRRSLSR